MGSLAVAITLTLVTVALIWRAVRLSLLAKALGATEKMLRATQTPVTEQENEQLDVLLDLIGKGYDQEVVAKIRELPPRLLVAMRAKVVEADRLAKKRLEKLRARLPGAGVERN